ncbi:MAG: restriction endonuclease [Candidatus Rokuibacteriota bacterium]|nr:MAG: restriction endonuclease [Candidatus Rokubacteria bacterium]
MSTRLPFEIREAVVQVCGKAFWLKDPFRGFLLSCGVPPAVYDRYSDESKFKIARHVLAEMDAMGEEGFQVQRRIVTELAKLRKAPDESVPNMDAALGALRYLKELAVNQKLLVEDERKADDTRTQEARRKQAALAARAQKMEELRRTFNGWAGTQDDPQSRGYGLEDLLAELFELHEISYRRPYRTATEQIDGHFPFKGFDYLVEARWRAGPPNEADLGAFKTKVDKKITSTRGLFVSVPGYRPEVLLEFTRGVSSNIVLMDGQDLALILEGHVSLTDALDLKIQKAAQEGVIFFPLSQRFSGG